jgi:hypothetical protein
MKMRKCKPAGMPLALIFLTGLRVAAQKAAQRVGRRQGELEWGFGEQRDGYGA